MALELWVVAIGLALLFDFYNGVNDAANAIATVVATRVLTPLQATGLAAVANFAGPFFFGTAVAKSVGSGILDDAHSTTLVLMAAVVGGILTTAVATKFGLPISVSHSLIGGLLGAGLGAAGAGALQLPQRAEVWGVLELVLLGLMAGAAVGAVVAIATGAKRMRWPVTVVSMLGATSAVIYGVVGGALTMGKVTGTLLFIVFSPLIGFFAAALLALLVMRAFHARNPRSLNSYFRRLQLVSASLYGLSHGTNDAQKTMGIITAVLLAEGLIPSFEIPVWVILSSAGAIALGTFLGGWRVIHTLGHRLTKLEPYQGFSAESASAATLFTMAGLGVPVSTTHSITGCILGVGAARSAGAVRWTVAREIITAWVLTIPVSGAVALVSYKVLALFL